MKKCAKCKNDKPLSSFSISSGRKDGRYCYCRDCVKPIRRERYLRKKQKELTINKKWRATHRKKMNEYSQAWRDRNPEKMAAYNKYVVAIRYGRLKKQPCEVCGSKVSEGHHHDYSKPLDVRWLCKDHHEEAHHGVA